MRFQKLTQSIMFSAMLASFLLCSCSGPSSSSGANSPTPSSASNADVQPQSPAAKIDPCSKFSAADAQAVMGVPMKLFAGAWGRGLHV